MSKRFSEILDEQLSQIPSENSGDHADSFYSSHVEYAHFLQIRFSGLRSSGTAPYAIPRGSYRSWARAGVTQPPLQIPVDYILESHQKASLDYLNERLDLSQRLIGQFSDRQLKTAFRCLAKVSHPDLGGTPESFRELITHFKVMSLFLTSRKEPCKSDS